MKSGKKLLSLILALCMVLSVIGVAAFAADTESSEPVGDQPVALSVPNAQDLKGWWRSISAARKHLPILWPIPLGES